MVSLRFYPFLLESLLFSRRRAFPSRRVLCFIRGLGRYFVTDRESGSHFPCVVVTELEAAKWPRCLNSRTAPPTSIIGSMAKRVFVDFEALCVTDDVILQAVIFRILFADSTFIR